MFLEKLWLRLRGEILALKEDLTAEMDLRDKAATLLETLERRVSGTDAQESQRPAERESDRPERSADPMSLRDIEKEWEDLRRERDKSRQEPGARESSGPNPRQLG